MIVKAFLSFLLTGRDLFENLKRKIARKIFISNCQVGSNFTCSSKAKCINNTSKREKITIGHNCEINGSILIEGEGQISIGDYTTVRYSSRIFSARKINIGSHVIISNNVTIYDHNSHPVEPEKRLEMSKSGFYGDLWGSKHASNAPIIIEDNVWVGERSSILKGVTIGKGSIVAMAAVVTKDVPPYSIVAGNPAKIVKKLLHI